ncbi:oligosaccharide flippase family protein [Candidatus Saccharibacteria bacterium]|nr:oligosaccharide flippase family protein [Candidatus Saccharibacteria bacterium]
MRQKLVQAYQSPFLRQNAVFFVGSMVVAALNYLYYPVLARLLSTEAFGELQVLVSVVTQAAILLQVFSLVATNIVVNEKHKDATNAVLSELQKLSLWMGVVFAAAVAALAPVLQAALKFESGLPFVVIGLIFLASIPPTFTGAYLRAKKDFKSASQTQALGSVAKLVFSAALVFIGFQALGAVVGLLIAQIVTAVYTAHRARNLGYRFMKGKGRGVDISLVRPHIKYAIFVLITSLITTGMVTIDSIAVKYFLSPTEAGLYGGISTIARIIYFLTGSIGLVLLSSVKLEQLPAKNVSLLLRSFALTLGLGGSALLVFALFPSFIIHLLMGPRYDEYAHYLPLLAAAILAISLSQLLTQYHIALRHFVVAVPVVLGALVMAVALLVHHQSIEAIIQSLAIGSATLLGGLLLWTASRALPRA